MTVLMFILLVWIVRQTSNCKLIHVCKHSDHCTPYYPRHQQIGLEDGRTLRTAGHVRIGKFYVEEEEKEEVLLFLAFLQHCLKQNKR